jgi:hypothetical protein
MGEKKVRFKNFFSRFAAHFAALVTLLPLLLIGLMETLLVATWSVPGGNVLAPAYFSFVWGEGAKRRGTLFYKLQQTTNAALSEYCTPYMNKPATPDDAYLDVKLDEPPPVQPEQLRRILHAPDLYLRSEKRLTYVYFFREHDDSWSAATYDFHRDSLRHDCLIGMMTLKNAGHRSWADYRDFAAGTNRPLRRQTARLRNRLMEGTAAQRKNSVAEWRDFTDEMFEILKTGGPAAQRNAALDLAAIGETAEGASAAADFLLKTTDILFRRLSDSTGDAIQARSLAVGRPWTALSPTYVYVCGKIGKNLGRLGEPGVHEAHVRQLSRLLFEDDRLLVNATLAALAELDYRSAAAAPNLVAWLARETNAAMDEQLIGQPPRSAEAPSAAIEAIKTEERMLQVLQLLNRIGSPAEGVLPHLRLIESDPRPKVRAAAGMVARRLETQIP